MPADRARAYLDERLRLGINALVVMLAAHHERIGSPKNAYGEPPFHPPSAFGVANEAYMRHADTVIEMAAQRGMLVVLAPAYAGYGGTEKEGWMPFMRALGEAGMYEWGRYLGRRFRDRRNILWLHGGDYNPVNEQERALVRATALGMLETNPQALQTFHGARGTSALQFWQGSEDWLNVNVIYTDDSHVVTAARTAYADARMPFFLVEAYYEGHRGSDGRTVRLQAYHALLAGGSIGIVGREGVWEFGDRWEMLRNGAGVRSVPVMSRLINSLPWWALRPDLEGGLIQGGACDGREQAVAAIGDDASMALIYLPAMRPITLDLRRLRGRIVAATWIDPVSGSKIEAGGHPWSSGESRRHIMPPGKNIAGASDWLLLLRAS